MVVVVEFAFAARGYPPIIARSGGPSDLVDNLCRVAYDRDLANRIRELISDDGDVDEKPMFGGLAFLVGGHIAVAASGHGGLMVRVDARETDRLLTRSYTRPLEMRGRQMGGWLRVETDGLHTKRQLQGWVRRGVAEARLLPPKH